MTTCGNSIRSAIENLPTLGVIDAHELAYLIVDNVIGVLMRDPNNTRSRREWAVALADTRARVVGKSIGAFMGMPSLMMC